jgi:hypothetical protein
MPETQPTRRIAIIVWCAIAGGLSIFGIVATVVGPELWSHNREVSFIAWLAAGLAIFLVIASRLIPHRAKLRVPNPGSAALTRTIIASALCEGGGLFGCVAWMLTGNTWAVVAMAVGLAGLLMAFPTEARWRELGGGVSPGAPAERSNRMVR